VKGSETQNVCVKQQAIFKGEVFMFANAGNIYWGFVGYCGFVWF